MILEEGTDEQMKRCIALACLPLVGSKWKWRDQATVLKVLHVDEDMVYAQFSDLKLSFQYTAEYWARELVALPDWRQV